MDVREHLFNNLSQWEKKRKLYPIHKRLLPFVYKGKACEDVNDALLQEAFRPGETLLDAGCGVGNSLISFVKKKSARGFGISISAAEIDCCKKNAAEQGVGESCTFFHQSFEDPFSFDFDKAIAIESLKHSFDLKRTASNLSAHCKPGGLVYVIDDFYRETYTTERQSARRLHCEQALQAQYVKDWGLAGLFSKAEFQQAFTLAGFEICEETDFSAHIIPKQGIALLAKICLFRLLEKLMPVRRYKNLLAIYKSGFILEYFFQKKQFGYELLVFRKPPIKTSASERSF